jgi:transglutaminase-like putative cysteine protease
MASAYAPGLKPMDFHALAEAWVDGAWQVIDATRLAPRFSLVRIATGRDAADIPFLSNHFAGLTLTRVEVGAVADTLPHDDHTLPAFLP